LSIFGQTVVLLRSFFCGTSFCVSGRHIYTFNAVNKFWQTFPDPPIFITRNSMCLAWKKGETSIDLRYVEQRNS